MGPVPDLKNQPPDMFYGEFLETLTKKTRFTNKSPVYGTTGGHLLELYPEAARWNYIRKTSAGIISGGWHSPAGGTALRMAQPCGGHRPADGTALLMALACRRHSPADATALRMTRPCGWLEFVQRSTAMILGTPWVQGAGSWIQGREYWMQ